MLRTDLSTNMEKNQVTNHMIEQGNVEMILNRNPINIVNIVIRMIIHAYTAGRCKPM